MVFRSKVDAFFVNFILSVVLIIASTLFFPLFFEEVRNDLTARNEFVVVVLIMTSIFLIVIGILLWTNFSIKYIFYQDYLLIKGGPFRSRIPYEKITKISPTTAIFTVLRILSSRDGLEIFNNNIYGRYKNFTKR